ncbi:uncharacterized protein LOC143255457 [Tachypleus tridentatus]|uniref:uncharacterized protein LOC143255457 n=1 Tax=Tachypleus tridentatus TaxID=6853 RepID=UPI003FD0EF87
MFGSENEMENKEVPEDKTENTKEHVNEIKSQEEDMKKQSVEEMLEKNDYKDNDKTVKKRHDRSSSSSSSDSSRGKSRSRSRSRERRYRKSKSRERSRFGGSRNRRTRSRSRSPRKGSDRRSRRRTRSNSRYRTGHGRSPPRRYRSRSRRSRSRDRYRRDRSRERSYGGRDRKGRYSPRRSRSRSKSKQMLYRQGGQIKVDEKNSSSKKDSKQGDSTDSNSGLVEKPSNLPLNDVGTSGMTPQMALQQQMAAMSAKAQALTGISLPKYYNPAAVNPLKYAEQQQKRKLLWQANKEKDKAPASSAVWEKLSFSQDQDGKMTAKFRKLMGIKEEGGESGCSESVEGKPQPQTEDEALKQQESLFRDLDQQYEIARMSTHTHRGVGLGYSSQPTAFFPPVQK